MSDLLAGRIAQARKPRYMLGSEVEIEPTRLSRSLRGRIDVTPGDRERIVKLGRKFNLTADECFM